MMSLAQTFWMRCEHSEPVFSADELRWTPPEEIERFRACGFLREAALATRAVCESCDAGHAEEVVWIRNMQTGLLKPFLPCLEVGGASVSPERLRRWAIDLDRTAGELRERLGSLGIRCHFSPGASGHSDGDIWPDDSGISSSCVGQPGRTCNFSGKGAVTSKTLRLP